MLPKFSSASKGEINNTQGNRSLQKKRLHGRHFFFGI